MTSNYIWAIIILISILFNEELYTLLSYFMNLSQNYLLHNLYQWSLQHMCNRLDTTCFLHMFLESSDIHSSMNMPLSIKTDNIYIFPINMYNIYMSLSTNKDNIYMIQSTKITNWLYVHVPINNRNCQHLHVSYQQKLTLFKCSLSTKTGNICINRLQQIKHTTIEIFLFIINTCTLLYNCGG